MALRDLCAFQVPDYLRRSWVDKTQFFFEQANRRLLAQFADGALKADADEHARTAYEKMGEWFDPEIHDPGCDAEDADCVPRDGVGAPTLGEVEA